jgi:hypothetical protein
MNSSISLPQKRRLKMVIIGILSYPPESAKEMAKRFIEQPPLPAYITMKGPYFSSEVGEGMKSVVIYEFDQSKFSEVNQFIITRYTKYYGVPGFTCSTNTWLEAKEALKAIGMG